MEVPILYYNVDGTQVFRHEILKDIFEKVGSRPFVVLSINGIRNTGKSYLLTQLLRTLNPELPDIEWNHPEDEPSVGIGLWSEPIKFNDKFGAEMDLILLKSTINLEPPATVQQNAIVSALSLAMSSLLILNLRKNISKENLAFLQYFLNLAKSFQDGGSAQDFKFQRILFLVRDMDLRVKDFAHGYHTPTTKPPPTAHSQTNLFTQIFSIDPTRQPLEIQHTYRQVLSAFKELGLFALPEKAVVSISNHVDRTVDLEFQNYVQALLDLLVGAGNNGLLQNEKKVIGDLDVKGYDFLEVIDQLGRSLNKIRNSSVQNYENSGSSVSVAESSSFVGEQSRAEMLNRIATTNLLSLYVSTISDFLTEYGRRSGKVAMYQKTLAEKMNSFLKICLDTFSRRLSQGDDELKVKYREILSSAIEVKMKLFESLNESRLKYGRETASLKIAVTSVLEQLETLRLQNEELETEGSEEELDRRLRSVRSVHLRKQIEECEGRLFRIQQKLADTQDENQKNLDQIINLINNISHFY